jgi:hypothetical protein
MFVEYLFIESCYNGDYEQVKQIISTHVITDDIIYKAISICIYRDFIIIFRFLINRLDIKELKKIGKLELWLELANIFNNTILSIWILEQIVLT